MVEKVAKFEKISYDQWHKDFGDNDQHSFDAVLDEIVRPTRATKGSAGYDIHSPYAIDLEPNQDIVVPTGLKCKIANGWFMGAFPKSGLGFKYYVRLANTIGIIDEDYYNNEKNEGHIYVKIRNESNETLHVDAGKGICQMIFIPYGITEDDDADGIRKGGIGSTNS